MKIELVQYTPNAEINIERAMRVCHGGDCDPNGTVNKTFVQNIIKLGHESPLEHSLVTFKITGVSRALTHQLVRHRIASYTQKSQRYCKEDPFEYVIPPEIEKDPETKEIFEKHIEKCLDSYRQLIAHNIKREDARYVLPNACCSDIYVTMNFRELRSFFKLRCERHAQWEIRSLAKKMLSMVYDRFPVVFEDLYNMFILNK